MGHQAIVGVLRELVVLCGAFVTICNGHPASEVIKNQVLVKTENVQKCPKPL
jgi:hypothetical protein